MSVLQKLRKEIERGGFDPQFNVPQGSPCGCFLFHLGNVTSTSDDNWNLSYTVLRKVLVDMEPAVADQAFSAQALRAKGVVTVDTALAVVDKAIQLEKEKEQYGT